MTRILPDSYWGVKEFLGKIHFKRNTQKSEEIRPQSNKTIKQ